MSLLLIYSKHTDSYAKSRTRSQAVDVSPAALSTFQFFELTISIQFSSSADIWSVGCTVIEMATGKPPWSHEYQEVNRNSCLSCGIYRHRLFLTDIKSFQVSLLYHVGTTKSHPPIPEHLSPEAKDFLLKCLQKYILILYTSL